MRVNFSKSYPSVIVALGLLFATFLVHRSAIESQAERIQSVTSTFASGFTAKLAAHVLVRLGAIDLIRNDWERGRIPDLDGFRAEALSVHHLFDDLQALNWVNPDGIIEVVTPLEGNEAALGLNVRRLAAPGKTLADAEAAGELRVTPPISLAQGGTGFVAYLPLVSHGRPDGFLNIVFRADPLIKSALGQNSARSFQVWVRDGPDFLFGEGEPDSSSPHLTETKVDIGGRSWTVLAAPTPHYIAGAQTYTDEIVLIFGVFASVATSILFHFATSRQIALKASEERFALAMRGANDGLWDWDPSSGETFFSPRWYEMLGYAPGELPNTYETFVSLLHPDDKQAATSHPEEIIARDGDALESEFRLRHKNGSWVNVLSRAFIVRENGKVARIVGTHVDITQLRQQQLKLERAAVTDDLTGLRNRRGLSDLLAETASGLHAGQRLAVLHIDLDKFKSINDTIGHDAGDHVLRCTAEKLLSMTGETDIVARIGGDEFLIARKTSDPDANVVAFCNDLIKQINAPVPYHERQCHVGASLGVAFCDSRNAGSMNDVIADADIALNSAKKSGRATCRVFSGDMRASAVQTALLSDQIRKGVRNREFQPFFQPQVDIQTMDIIGFEALARWHHPTRGVLTADTFISVAQEARLVEDIDNGIFESACEMIPKLAACGLSDPRISVNVSTAQLSNPRLVDRLIWKADAMDIDSASIGIEILESTMLDDRAANVIDNIHRLAREGFSIELDDFGTGHAAIANLREFPVSKIKIDRSLVTGIDHDNELQLITCAIIDLARKLGKKVLAEGIETVEEMAFLQGAGCTCAQGYLFARPMPAEALASWIETWQSGRKRPRLRAAIA